MASITVTDKAVSVHFSRWEKIAGMLRDIDVPRADIADVTVAPDGVAAVHGFKEAGLNLPGYRKAGTFRSRNKRVLVSVKRGEPALRLTGRAGSDSPDILIGSAQAAAIAEELQKSL
jgi:hypothetical protein